ncbi:MAG: DNA polymerase [Verrucomicrobiales bacterium]|nr:DNA polymerase [Verrucomicrobiales bacterium]
MSKPKKNNTKPSDPFIIGIDAEYVERGESNYLLSFQWYVIFRDKHDKGILYADGKRPTLSQLLRTILSQAKENGLFKHYPKSVYLAAHFSVAEFHLFSDFGALKSQVDTVKNTFVTVAQPISCRITSESRNQNTIQVILRDTKLLTPGGGALWKLGEMHNIPKLEIEDNMKEQMDQLLAKERDLFERYAIRDAEIAAKHALWCSKQNKFLTGDASIPITIGGFAASFCLKRWESTGIKHYEIIGHEKKYKTIRTGKRSYLKPIDSVAKYEHLARQAYQGGRNEAFWFGPTPEGSIIDVDLVSAYPSVMASMGMPRWEDMESVESVYDFKDGDIGFARVTFSFPNSVSYPCLPVRTEEDSLLFPLNGESYVTAAEIRCAVKMGAEIIIHDGLRVPTDQTIKPFSDPVESLLGLRKAFTNAGLHHHARFYKELVNSLYGKTSQGLRAKTVFDSRSGASKLMPDNKLTQPYLAAHITGGVRAVMSEAIHEITKAGFNVYSVTTDGILTDAPQEIVHTAFQGDCATPVIEARKALTGSEEIVEIKQRVRKCVITGARGTFTIKRGDTGEIVLAKAGVQTPAGLDKKNQNNWMLEKFFSREFNDAFELNNLRPIREIYRNNSDLVRVKKEVASNLEHDMRRNLTEPQQIPVRLRPHETHVACQTLPWHTIEEYTAARQRWREWKKSEHTLKTIEDYDDWEDYHLAGQLRSNGLRGRLTGGCYGAAIKQFLRAFTSSSWGLREHQAAMTYAKAASTMQNAGIDVSEQDFKNAARNNTSLVRHAIPTSRRVLELTGTITVIFPGFDPTQMLKDS